MNNTYDLESLIKKSLKEGEEVIMANKPSFNKLKLRLRSDKTEVTFSTRKRLIFKPSVLVAILTIILTVGFTFGIYAKDMLRTDKIDYPFIDDPSIIGKWQSVDFVKDVDTFNPESKSWGGSLYLKEMAFIKSGKILASINEGNGKLVPADIRWTKGIVINPQIKTASSYIIKDINGTSYMFYQWKSGDYIFREMEPNYYVLKKVDSNDYSGYSPKKTIDKIDYSFEADPRIIGEWKSVDIVSKPEDYSTDNISYKTGLYLKKLIFEKDGAIKSVVNSNSKDITNTKGLSWTKGIVIDKNNQTASKYEIKEINGETHMFYEWKSGDYTLRGMEPKYYVLKKVK